MARNGIACAAIENLGWGLRTQLRLPGGGRLGIYEPRHARPPQSAATKSARKPARRASGKAGRKPATKKSPRKPSRKKKTSRRAAPKPRRRTR
jgi:hypothetical protein